MLSCPAPWSKEPPSIQPDAASVYTAGLIWKDALSAKTRGFHTQLDEGPETPRATREASGVPFLRQDEA